MGGERCTICALMQGSIVTRRFVGCNRVGVEGKKNGYVSSPLRHAGMVTWRSELDARFPLTGGSIPEVQSCNSCWERSFQC